MKKMCAIGLQEIDANHNVGPKAYNLARLLQADLPAPQAVVIPYEEVNGYLSEVEEGIAALTFSGPFIIRSSANVEDGMRAAMPGLFLSVGPVGMDGLANAIRQVATSVPQVLPQGIEGHEMETIVGKKIRVAVIVQEYIEGRAGTLYTRAPGDPSSKYGMAQHNQALGCIRREDGHLIWSGPTFELSKEQTQELMQLALRAEEVISAPDGADIEWVLTDDGLYLLQARPIIHPTNVMSRPPSILFQFSCAEPEIVWKWDAVHNPEPLSPCQIGLIEACAVRDADIRMRVIGGYLYFRESTSEVVAETNAEPELDVCEVNKKATEEQEYICRVREVTSQIEKVPLQEVVNLFVEAMRFQQTVSRYNQGSEGSLSEDRNSYLPSEELFSVMSHGWDICLQTMQEIGIDRPRDATFVGPTKDVLRLQDDELAYVSQWMVRKKLLHVARLWQLKDPQNIFHMPLGVIISKEKDAVDDIEVQRIASASRAIIETQREWSMPIAIQNGCPLMQPAVSEDNMWRGMGTGDSITAPAWIFDPDKLKNVKDVVVVCKTVTPALVVLLQNASALIIEHGGLLDHGPAMARELNIPCLVGCHGITNAISPGTQITVNGTNGTAHINETQ